MLNFINIYFFEPLSSRLQSKDPPNLDTFELLEVFQLIHLA
ncbi:22262_t:CDS:1, partial [Gigaspora rosea]